MDVPAPPHVPKGPLNLEGGLKNDSRNAGKEDFNNLIFKISQGNIPLGSPLDAHASDALTHPIKILPMALQALTRPQSSSYSVQGERREKWVPRKGVQGEMGREKAKEVIFSSSPFPSSPAPLPHAQLFAACYMKTWNLCWYLCFCWDTFRYLKFGLFWQCKNGGFPSLRMQVILDSRVGIVSASYKIKVARDT